MGRLDGKVAIITGAAGYLGSATAKLFAQEGARVVCADIDAGRLDALQSAIGSEGGIAATFQLDVTQEDQIAGLIEFSVQTYGRLDVLHNNATAPSPLGIGKDGNVVTTPDAEWDWALRINLYPAIWGCRHAIPRMIETGGGSIINMASMLYRQGSNELIAMGVSKAAIVAFSKYVATSHGKAGIRANTIAPGFTMSPDRTARLPTLFTEVHRQQVTTPRLGIATDQAYAALYLASDESAFFTGQVLEVDGGLGIQSPTAPRLAAESVGISSYKTD